MGMMKPKAQDGMMGGGMMMPMMPMMGGDSKKM